MAMRPVEEEKMRNFIREALQKPAEHPQLIQLIVDNNVRRGIPSPPDTVHLAWCVNVIAKRLLMLEERSRRLEQLRERRLEHMQRQLDAIAALVTSSSPKKHNAQYSQI